MKNTKKYVLKDIGKISSIKNPFLPNCPKEGYNLSPNREPNKPHNSLLCHNKQLTITI